MTDREKGRCLVLGGYGFVGSHIADGLLEKGYAVAIFDKEHINRENISPKSGTITVMLD